MPEWKVPGYTELKGLGSGGFGDVVLARHGASGVAVAIKYLRRELLTDEEFATMFRGEAATLASLDDLNVVRLYEYVESPSGAAIVMELVDGVSLRDLLARQGQTTPEAALVVLQGSLLGLAAAHRRGVVHRDYKPENVLVDGEGMSKLTDFGIAARAGELPIPAGTLVYAPPEQMAGAPATPAGDVYSATATFYECLAGRPPFTGNTAEVLLRQHRVEPVPLEPVPEPLRPLVTAGMAKNPRQRPADAAAFVAGLETIASGAYGPGWHERGRSRLGEAALLLAALWPSGTPPAVQGTEVYRIRLFRRFSPVRAAITAGVAIAVVAAAAAAITRPAPLKPSSLNHPVPVQSVVLGPAVSSSLSSVSPSPSPSPSPKHTPSPSPSPTSAAPTSAAPTSLAPSSSAPPPSPSSSPSSPSSPSSKPSPSKSPSPSPSPSPSASSSSPSPTPTPTTTSPTPTPSPSTSTPGRAVPA